VDKEKANFYRGKKVTILGMGRSGRGLAKLLKSIGANVFCSDSGELNNLENLDYPFEVGGHTNRVFDADLLAVSPGIPVNSDVIKKAQMLGIKVRGELDLSAELLDCPYTAVTGTSGKSTTTSLIAYMLNGSLIKSKPVGNIGDALSNYVKDVDSKWILSIEVSSFQCELMETFHPKSAVFTNLGEDHLNRHGSMEIYGTLKQKMLQCMDASNLVVLNADDAWSSSLSSKTSARSIFFSRLNPNANAYFDGDNINIDSKHVVKFSDFKLFGYFNALNLMAAALAVTACGVDPAKALTSALDFTPLHHRMELVGIFNNIRYINDSKATKPDATVLTLSALEGPFILILGGSEKGSDFKILLPAMSKVKQAIIHGATADHIARALTNGGFKSFIVVPTQHDAIIRALKIAKKGDTVLLSPACASFDQFEDYERRGEIFTMEVRELAQKKL